MKKRPQMGAGKLIMLVLSIAIYTHEVETAPVIRGTGTMRYLAQFGYLPPLDSGSEESISAEAMSTAISKFQNFWGIDVTGDMNAETAHLMTLPRCGVEDIDETETGGRRKRYVLRGTKWERKNLTYKIGKYSSKLSRSKVDKEIARAFAQWSKHTDLTFAPKSGEVDIEVRFESGDHGDGRPFDGSSGSIIAHGFFPHAGGDIHFDDDEEWTTNSYLGHNLFAVAVHEAGHSLGLRHSDIKASAMYPRKRRYNPNFKLTSDDIAGIKAIYGPKTKKVPKICDNHEIDTIFASPEGGIYAFRGRHYWTLTRHGVADGYPKVIAETWKGLPKNIELAFTNENRETYFIKGSKYWVYDGKQMRNGYAKTIGNGTIKLPDAMTILKGTIEAHRRTSSLAMEIYCTFNNLTAKFQQKLPNSFKK